ncbi:Receptor-like protein kinase HAIKU2, partial [Camellia lanceoleosa]
YLDLGMNSFAGKFPDLSSLTQLKFLNLNHNGFSGQFPWKSLENLTSLEFLSLGDNPFNGSPFPLEILNLHKLYWVYLTNSSIEGEIPEGIGNLTLLQNLELSYNQLSGKIPKGITKLKNLWQLELYTNQLSGKLPNGFRNLTNLINFDASTNSLEGDLSEIKYLTKIVSLQLFENKFSSEIPIELGEFKSLTNLSLYTNKLTGSIPPNIGSYGNFTFIDVLENFLTGSIPPNMCQNGKISELLMLRNNFTVNNNSLSGKIPVGIWSLLNLSIIDLTMNQFEGPLSDTVGEAKSLAQLFLSHNQFSGELPATISESTSLVDIEFGSNQFSGEIPATIGNLKKLSNLHLENDVFSGTIPESLGSCVSLIDINLAGNSFSGKIPASIGSLRSLNSLNISHNELSGETVSLSSLKLSILDLSNNRLMGRIPDSLLIEAFVGGFARNPGLCGENMRNLQPCSSDSGKSSNVRTVISCFVARAAVLFMSLACFMYVKYKYKPENQDRWIKRYSSLDMKQLHMLSFTEEEVMNAIKKENLIGKGGSGNVYKVMLGNGKQLAVKHIWKSDSGGWRTCWSSLVMIPKGNLWSLEHDAELATLSSIRHVNVVKLYCCITSEDWNLLVYENLPNGKYAYTSKVNEKSDVYSFGVVLIELVTGKRPVEPKFGENKDIVQWVCGEMRSKGGSIHLVDAAISEAMKEDAARVLRIAVHCTMKTPALRPSMRMEEAEPCNLTGIIVSKDGKNSKS